MNKKRKSKLNNRGTTLVELIVSFTLLSLFMVAATRVISYTVSVYYEAKSISNGLQITNLLSRKIVYELENSVSYSNVTLNAQEWSDDEKITINKGSYDEDSNMLIANDGSSIVYFDAAGNQVYIGVDKDGYLVFHYYPVIVGGDGSHDRASVDWKYDAKAYMGYTVKSIKFSQAMYNENGSLNKDYDKNILKLELTVYSGRYGEYSTTQYIKCYNFANQGVISSADYSYGK